MALNFTKTAAAQQSPQAKTQTQTQAAPASGAAAGFFKKGAAAKEAMAQSEAQAEQAKLERGKLFRFFMGPNEERKLTFLDGDMDADGMIDAQYFNEHMLKVAGEWKHYPCTMETEGHCPICDKGDSRSYFVMALTIIDHTPYTVKSGKNAGKTYQNTRRLFVCKRETIQQLTKLASHVGGLRGQTFIVTRGGDKTASVGNQFIPKEKLTPQQIMEQYGLKQEDVQPADYEKEITYISADELIELGIGKKPTGPGYEKSVSDKVKSAL